MIGIIVCTTQCNLACQYCYETDSGVRSNASRERINQAFSNAIPDIENFVYTIATAAKARNRQAEIIFHGGEPLLVHWKHLKSVFEFAALFDSVQIVVQTNGSLITDSIVSILRDYQANVVVSLDGPDDMHDMYRQYRGGQSTHAVLMRNLERLRKHDVSVSALATVTDLTCTNPERFYVFFKDENLDFSVHRCFAADNIHMQPGVITKSTYRDFLTQLLSMYWQQASKRFNIPCVDRLSSLLSTTQRNAVVVKKNTYPFLSVYQCETNRFHIKDPVKIGPLTQVELLLRALLETPPDQMDETGALVDPMDFVIQHMLQQEEKNLVSAIEVNQGR